MFVLSKPRKQLTIKAMHAEQIKTRPTLSQFLNFIVRGATLLNLIKLADLLIARLTNCEKAGWDNLTRNHNRPFT